MSYVLRAAKPISPAHKRYDPITQAQTTKNLLRARRHPLKLRLRILRTNHAHKLRLLKLMLTKHAASVAARSSRLRGENTESPTSHESAKPTPIRSSHEPNSSTKPPPSESSNDRRSSRTNRHGTSEAVPCRTSPTSDVNSEATSQRNHAPQHEDQA